MDSPNGAPELARLNGAARKRLGALLSKSWSLPGDHPLSRLHDAELGPYRLYALLGPKNHVGSQYFHLFLSDGSGALANEELAQGLYNSGPYPAFNWLELIRLNSQLELNGNTVDLTGDDLDLRLFEMIARLIPPGGHLMVEYDSPSQQPTERVVTRGFPAVVSRTGYLMFRVGVRSFRDWYISEGGREGPRKLQGFFPLNDEIAADKTASLRAELEALLAQQAAAPPFLAVAREVLATLQD